MDIKTTFCDLKDFQIGRVERKVYGFFDSSYTNTAYICYQNRKYVCSEHTYRFDSYCDEYYCVEYLNNGAKPPLSWDDSIRHYRGYEENVLGCLLLLFEDLPYGSVIKSSKAGERILGEIKEAMRIRKIGFYGRKRYLLRKIKEKCIDRNITLDLSEWYNVIVSKTFVKEVDRMVTGYMRDPYSYHAYIYEVVYADGRKELVEQRYLDYCNTVK